MQWIKPANVSLANIPSLYLKPHLIVRHFNEVIQNLIAVNLMFRNTGLLDSWDPSPLHISTPISTTEMFNIYRVFGVSAIYHQYNSNT